MDVMSKRPGENKRPTMPSNPTTALEDLTKLLGGDRIECIDVGARGGMPKTWRSFDRILNLYAFEPDAAACQVQSEKAAPNHHWFPVAVAEHTGKGTVYVVRKPSSSSMFPPNPAESARYDYGGHRELDKTVSIDTVSLSDFLKNQKAPLPNLLKLDTQGMELAILRGLKPEDWRDVIAIQTEFTLIERYLGEPMFGELDAFVKSSGLALYDLLPVRKYRTGGVERHHYLKKHLGISRNRRDLSARAVAGDAIYFRPVEEIVARGDKKMVAKAVVILVMYRFLDEAFWLVEEAQKQRIVSPDEGQQLLNLVKDAAPRPLPWQRVGAVGKWSRRLLRALGISKRRQIEYWMDRSWDN
jgi:FkbM family methyltransferase